MTQQETYSDSARVAYDAFAEKYDEFNKQNDYEVWLGEVLLPELEKHGLARGGRVLDVGCGTGKAFDTLLRRGWSVWGVDVSAEMLAVAKAKLPDPWGYRGTCELRQHDARELPTPLIWHYPTFGNRTPRAVKFDLVLALNDVVNYLTEDGDLERCFEGMQKNLAPDGLVCFDANTLGLMRTNFAGEGMARGEWLWRGDAESVEAGGTYEALVSGPDMETTLHRQRHWTEEEVREALETSGLRCLARLGHFEDGKTIVLKDPPDEDRDLKVIYIAGRADAAH